jgi:hypothetical protein
LEGAAEESGRGGWITRNGILGAGVLAPDPVLAMLFDLVHHPVGGVDQFESGARRVAERHRTDADTDRPGVCRGDGLQLGVQPTKVDERAVLGDREGAMRSAHAADLRIGRLMECPSVAQPGQRVRSGEPLFVGQLDRHCGDQRREQPEEHEPRKAIQGRHEPVRDGRGTQGDFDQRPRQGDGSDDRGADGTACGGQQKHRNQVHHGEGDIGTVT